MLNSASLSPRQSYSLKAYYNTALIDVRLLTSRIEPPMGSCTAGQVDVRPRFLKHAQHSHIKLSVACSSSSSGSSPSWRSGGAGPDRGSSLTGIGSGTSTTSTTGNGVFVMMLVCSLFFLADNLLQLPGCSALYLNHARPQWWQFITHMFCHGNLAHLSGNLFNLCVFGKMVEETEGPFGVLFIFLVCGLGAALATFFLTPATSNGHVTVSVGASGAIFGLFAVSVLSRLRWNLKQLLEAAVLGQFVVRQVFEEAKNQVAGGLTVGGMAVSHAAHIAGAAVGVILVLLLQRLPDDPAAGAVGGSK
ncbi:hypothetical protein VaNZ11_016905 [Volvox africanus]|uniref:Peptidase S54 rhomboid domain-containing protein n=1 Tax=Volvox africanus TaxID=51714 RepID=A0ABQ5SQH4_9CHLO|nr:hypothetical protein VaNZ11_016905 [Volvox africanus]